MKRLLSILVGLSCVCGLQAQDINPGISFTDGQRLTAAQLGQLVSQATIFPAFYTRQVAASTNLQSGDVFLVVNNGLFRKMTGASVFGNTLFFTSQATVTNIPAYATLLYYNPTNNTLDQISIANLGFAFPSNIVVSNLVFATNGVQLLTPYTNTLNIFNTTNQNQFITWDTNGIPYSLSGTNLARALVAPYGTNLLQPYFYTNSFVPWAIYPTNAASNAWGFFTSFAITNLFMTNNSGVVISNTQTLLNTDSFPVSSAGQSTNTTATLQALYQFLTNQTALLGKGFVSTNFALPAVTGLVTNVPHGLGVQPRLVRWVLVNTTAEGGWATNSEMSIESIVSADNSVNAGITFGSDTVNVSMSFNYGNGFGYANRTTGAFTTFVSTHWKAKVYVFP